MRRLWWLALVALVAAAVVLGPGRQQVGHREEPQDPYFPVELPADVQGRLVLQDHPWPHPNPIADPARFQGEQPETWVQRLDAAVAAFRRRFPRVEVVVDVRPFAPPAAPGDEGPEPPEAPPGTGGGEPDVVAVWWGGPLPAAGDLVPLNRYLTDEIMAQYHPAAWPLVESGGVYWGWPRWIALHYWIAPRGTAAAAGAAGGWMLADALPVAADGFLVPPAGGGLLLELAAGVLAPPPAEGDGEDGDARRGDGGEAGNRTGDGAGDGSSGGAGDGAGGDTGDGTGGGAGGEEAVAALAEALGRLRGLLSEAAADPGQRLVDARFGLAAGFGPALGHWAVSPPLSGRGRPDDRTLELLPPPAAAGAPAGLPVLSPGAYAVLRKAGPDEAVRAQLAVELARYLSTWQPEAAVARLLALPAHRPALERWRASPPLAAAVAGRLLGDLERSAAEGLRAYGRPAGGAPLDPAAVHQWWRQWMDGELDDETLARIILAGARDAGR